MSFLDRLGEIVKSQMTMDLEVKQLKEAMSEMRQQFQASDATVDRLEQSVVDLRERVALLEAQREADRAQMMAEISLFKSEVDRAEQRLSRLLPPSEPSK